MYIKVKLCHTLLEISWNMLEEHEVKNSVDLSNLAWLLFLLSVAHKTEALGISENDLNLGY